MTFREKFAWFMVALLTAAVGFYAFEVGGHWLAVGEAPPPSIKLAWVYVGIVVIGAIVGASTLVVGNPEEADAPADERERRAIDKAGNWSGYVLAFPAIAGVLHYWSSMDGNLLFHTIVGALLACQIAEYAFRIWLFRRGA